MLSKPIKVCTGCSEFIKNACFIDIRCIFDVYWNAACMHKGKHLQRDETDKGIDWYYKQTIKTKNTISCE